MTDFAAEQADEIEALESIFPDQFEILEPNKFQLGVAVEVDEFEGRSFNVSFKLAITYPEEYPDVVCTAELKDVEGLEEDAVSTLLSQLAETAEENVGMPMVFTLQSEALEWAEETAEKNLDYAKSEKDRIEQAEQDALLAKLTAGTVVDKETFAKWKKDFNEEMAKNPSGATQKLKPRTGGGGGMSGRQMFEKDAKKMATSEDKLSSPDDVVVDTSVFAGLDLEDLGDLDAEISDDD